MTGAAPPVPRRIAMGHLPVDVVTFDGALERIAALVEAGQGGTVFTPNVDHVVIAENDERFRAAYADASLSLADGMPVFWASRLLPVRLPEKVSGSDLAMPLLELASRRGWRVFLLGGAEGVAARVTEMMRERLPSLNVVGHDASRIDVSRGPDAVRSSPTVARVAQAAPHLVLVALGAPKQELWCHAVASTLRPAVLIGVGASLDFIAGVAKRAPRWMSSIGVEWLHRLAHDPRRLWRRYIVQDPKFVWIVARTWRRARGDRGA